MLKNIYTGAKKAILDMSKDANVEIVKEASERFGSDKIAVMLNKDYDFSKIKQLKYDGVSLIIADSCANECIGLGIKVLAFNCNFTFNDMVNRTRFTVFQITVLPEILTSLISKLS